MGPLLELAAWRESASDSDRAEWSRFTERLSTVAFSLRGEPTQAEVCAVIDAEFPEFVSEQVDDGICENCRSGCGWCVDLRRALSERRIAATVAS